MKWIRQITTAALLVFVVASLGLAVVDATGLCATQTPVGDSAQPEAKAPVVAYYFHTKTRCPTCRAIEENGQSSLAEAVHDGRVEWRIVNYDEPANKHFAKEFKLEFASLVLVAVDGGSPHRWKNLEKVWEHYDDPPAFARYVQQELATFMGSQP